MTDRRVVLLVVLQLGLFTLSAIGVAAALALTATKGDPVDPVAFGFFTGLAGTGIGAIAGILAHTSSTPAPMQTAPMVDATGIVADTDHKQGVEGAVQQ